MSAAAVIPWRLAVSGMLLTIPLLLAAAPGTDDTNQAELLWTEWRIHQEAGDWEESLRILAELTSIPAEEPAALLEAALIYLRQGQLPQAQRLVSRLLELPDSAADPDLQVKLHTVFGDLDAVRAVVERNPDHRWEARSVTLMRDAYRRLDVEMPEIVSHDLPSSGDDPGAVSIEFSILAYQNHPFRSDSGPQDTELATRLSVDFRRELSPRWHALASLRLSDERSLSDPVGFSPYRIERLRLAGGGEWRSPTSDLSAKLLLGGTFSRAVVYPDEERPRLGPHLDLEGQVEKRLGKGQAQVRHAESSFVNPGYTRLQIERYRRTTLRLRHPLATRLTAETHGSIVSFNKETEDYEEVGARLHYSPRRPANCALFLEAEHEFRRAPETTLAAGVEWAARLPSGLILYLLPRFTANHDTGEREAEIQAFLATGKTGSGTWSVGLGGVAELRRDHDRSLYLVLRWEP